MFQTVVENALSFSFNKRKKRNLNREFLKIFEQVLNEKVL